MIEGSATEETQALGFEPFKDIILGKIDPKTQTEKEFNNSPDILYHGTGDPNFFLNQAIDYEKFERPVSATLGEGFYCTDSEVEARIFSEVRQTSKSGPIVIRLQPYEARMLDTRLNNTTNVSVPRKFLEE